MVQAIDRRVRLLEAAHAVMSERGLVGCTTREIARQAGVAEGTIYNHFADKYDLCLAVIRERFAFPEKLAALPSRAGERPVREMLTDFMRDCLEFLELIVPMFSGVIGHPDLAELHRSERSQERGPLAAIRLLAAYLEAEQQAGSLGRGADPLMLAQVLFGTAFHHVHLKLLLGERRLEPRGKKFVESLVDVVLAAAGPAEAGSRKGG